MSLPRCPSFRLDGRRALVTGSTGAIGLASAVALAEEGAEVVLCGRDADKVAALVADFSEAGFAVSSFIADMTDVAQISNCVDGVGPIDILVNSAGLARHGPALEANEDDFDLVMSANLKGAYFLCQRVAQRLVKRGKPGSLITVSSQMGKVGGIERSVYCASKHGVEGLTKAMAIEWGQYGIRVNSLCPTFVRTPLTESSFNDPERFRWIMRNIPLGRVANVEDMMGAVKFLASDASAMVTGTALMVDGGWTAA